MRTNAKSTTCVIVGVCLIFAQLSPGMLAQDYENSPRIASNESQSSGDQLNSTNDQSEDVQTVASNKSQNSPPTQTPTPQVTPTDSNKKQRKSLKKWLLIGAGVAVAISAILLIKKSKPAPEVSVGTPSVGVPQ